MKWFQLGILGVTNTGKSYLTNRIVEHLSKTIDRIIIIDDLNQISVNGFTICESLNHFIQSIVDKKKFKLILRFNEIELDSYFDVFKIVWLFLDNSLVVIDEISILCTSYNIDTNLKNISQRGRLKNISFIYNTQRPANISRNISTQTEFIISFRLNELADLKYFYIDRAKIFQVQALENRRFLILRGEKERLMDCLNDFEISSEN